MIAHRVQNYGDSPHVADGLRDLDILGLGPEISQCRFLDGSVGGELLHCLEIRSEVEVGFLFNLLAYGRCGSVFIFIDIVETVNG